MQAERGPKTSDDLALARLGKKQVLKRRFNFLAIVGFAMAELITWETVLTLFSQSFENGGPAGAFFGYIIACLSTLSTYTVIAELASMAPIAGGQYYWVYMLAPMRWKKVCSYLIGWLTSLAWIATIATETIFLGTMIEGLITLNNPDFAQKRWQNTLLAWASVAGTFFINVVVPNILPRFEIFMLVLHLAGFIAITAVLLAMSPKKSADFVFHTVLNEGNWPTQGISYCVGFIGNIATFVGADASVHMAEEVANAAVVIPKAIIAGMSINSALGFSMMLTVLFCIGDVESVLNSATGFPFIQIFYNVTHSHAAASVMTALIIVLTMACSTGITATASRMTWSFARDRGLPFSRWLMQVNGRTHVPVVAVTVVCGLACALTLIYIGSTTAFNDVISLTVTGFYGTYLIPSAFLLYHRVRGHILPHGTMMDGLSEAGVFVNESAPASTEKSTMPLRPKSPENPETPRGVRSAHSPERSTAQRPHAPPTEYDIAQAPLIWGPWKVPGILGTINNAYACVYMVFVIFWSVWPPATPVDYTTMNYSIVVTGGVLILSGIWYVARARKEYSGPLIDEEVAEIMHLTPVAVAGAASKSE
ncbi:Choline transport protein [Penicillium ucsense]|uniref:Choline transport protein n=1 Tax=Penicillium ucsense TaxID=2839758 RepID=A0A8J8WM50_9EURO|nr:Choline transport protein [Penicillium ucsense]KAF7738321.1 Choline transport protein [Penicillium ucsense]